MSLTRATVLTTSILQQLLVRWLVHIVTHIHFVLTDSSFQVNLNTSTNILQIGFPLRAAKRCFFTRNDRTKGNRKNDHIEEKLSNLMRIGKN